MDVSWMNTIRWAVRACHAHNQQACFAPRIHGTSNIYMVHAQGNPHRYDNQLGAIHGVVHAFAARSNNRHASISRNGTEQRTTDRRLHSTQWMHLLFWNHRKHQPPAAMTALACWLGDPQSCALTVWLIWQC